jgi:hypothetical protein
MSALSFHCNVHRSHAQAGAVFIVMLVILVLGVATVLVASIGTVGLKNDRDAKTAEVLALAKEALIGKAAIYDDSPSRDPGNLPCPDTDNDGLSDAGGLSDCPLYIGRLPWKTLGLPDLRDGAGERLWYTLSSSVRPYDSVRPLNSDSQGTLNITGAFTANNQVAIVFAPGPPVSSQARGDINTACTPPAASDPKCMPSNYLEGTNDDPSPGAAPNVSYQSSNSTIEFNDQLLSISHDQLFVTIEKRVANEIKNLLKTYYTAWGAYPFAAPFSNPSTAPYIGQIGTYEGLLPVGSLFLNSTSLSWNTVPAPHYFINGVDSGTCYFSSSAASNSRLRCISSNITIPAGATVTFTGTLFGVGFGFWKKHDINSTNEFRVRDSTGTTVLASSKFTSPTITSTLNNDGSATITFSGTMKAGTVTQRTIQRIEFRDIQRYVSPTIPAWLVSETNDETPNCDANFDSCNDWHKLVYYAVAEEYAPGGAKNSCNTIPCLSVNGQNGGTNVKAVVIMTGRTLATPHHTASLNDYLEGENATAGDRNFLSQLRSATFNDQVIIVTP